MIKHFCDTCGKELKAGERYSGYWNIHSTWIKVNLIIENGKDYCWSCIKNDVLHALDFSMKEPGGKPC